MRDLTVVVMLLALAGVAWRLPWLGVLALVFVSIMPPQGYATGFMQGFPAYKALFVVVVLATAWQCWRLRALPTVFWDWRFLVLLLLGAHFLVTTATGYNPAAGWPWLVYVAKRLPLLLLTVLLIDSQEKLRWLLLTLALAVGSVLLKGGYWAIIHGFQDRVYGPPGSQFTDNNAFAVVTCMAIPLLALWYRQTEYAGLRIVVAVFIALGFASALSSWSRGGLLSASAVAILLAWHSRRKWLILPVLLAGVGLAFIALPEDWFARMQTLAAPQSEGSAASRLELWRLGWAYALEHPWTGGGFGGWIYLSLPTGGPPRSWHSAYIDLLAEHGFVGLALWGMLVVGSAVSLTRVMWDNRRLQVAGLTDQAAMLRASIAAYLVGAAFLSIAYWELLFIVLACAIVVSRVANQARGRERSLHGPD